jgi:hypothetical protein
MRLPQTMNAGLKAMAKEQGRSVTAQAEFLLEHAARDMGSKLYDLPPPIADLHDRVVEVKREVGEVRDLVITNYDRLLEALGYTVFEAVDQVDEPDRSRDVEQEPDRDRPLRGMYMEYGPGDEVGKLLPVEIEIKIAEDGNIVSVYRHDGQVIREIP